MALILDGTNGLSDVDGTAGTPAIRGSDANTGIFFPAADTIAFSEGGVESMRLNSNGNVGIGTTSPSARLTVGRVDSSNEGGQIDLCRASDNASAWAIDVFGNTSTPTLRIINGATVAASVDGSNNFAFNSGYGSAAVAYGCRAWVNFNGTTSPGTIRASGNVSSVTRNNTGDYTVNFTTAMPDANYAMPTSGALNDTFGDNPRTVQAGPINTTSGRLRTLDSASGAAVNLAFISVSIFR